MTPPRLRRALQLKQLLERVSVAALADAERRLADATRRLDETKREHERCIVDLREQTIVSAVELSERARFVAAADQHVRRDCVARDVEHEHREGRQADAHGATRDVRTLERLNERMQVETRTRHRRVEQQLLDEHGQRKRRDP